MAQAKEAELRVDMAHRKLSLRMRFGSATTPDGQNVVAFEYRDAAPVQFDQEPASLTPAPAHAVDTEQVLIEAGLTWEDLIRLKERGAIA